MRRTVITAAALALLLAACGGAETGPDEGPQAIRLITHGSFSISDQVWEQFEAETGHAVQLLISDDTGTMVSQAILSKDNPFGDVMFGVDNTFLGRALDEELFEEYVSPYLANVPDSLKLDTRATPIDFGDVCVNYDKAGLAARGLFPPRTLRDLTRPEYRGLLAVQHPGTSSPGLAFLLATVAAFGEDGDYTWRDFWAELADNDTAVTSGWEQAYYEMFSGGSGAGDRPLVVSYASSPPAEVIFADPRPETAPTGVMEDGCFRQIEFAGVINGTPVPNAARDLIDFMLGLTFQEDIPLNMFVFPAHEGAALPPEFVEHVSIPADPAGLSPETIDDNRSRWIEEWIETAGG